MQPPSGCKSQVLKNEDLCSLKVLELVPEPREIPLKGTDVEVTKRDRAKLALKGPVDRLPSDQGGRMLGQETVPLM